MAIAIALLDLMILDVRPVTPTFLFGNRFYLQLSPNFPKMNKKSHTISVPYCQIRVQDHEAFDSLT